MKQLHTLTEEEKLNLGRAYAKAIDEIKTERQPLVQTWRKAAEHYENKWPIEDWPWPNNVTSQASIPLIPTHTDAVWAREYATATGQDPIFWPEISGTSEFPNGVTADEFNKAWQHLSAYVENIDLPIKHIIATSQMIATKYGDAIIYAPYVQKEVYDYTYDEDLDEWVKAEDPREVVGKPELRVLHPENFYIPTNETGIDAIQKAKFVAYDFELDYNDIELLIRSEDFDPKIGKQLQELIRPKVESGPRQFLTDRGDSVSTTTSDDNLVRKDLFRLSGLEDEVKTGKLKFYHVWAREDTDNDGVEEEINFFIHGRTGLVPFIIWNPYHHRKRPFVRIQYHERDGMFYSMGIPEMLDNLAEVMTEIMRDILNNNKVQTTKAFVARTNSGIDPEMRVWPGRIVFVDQPGQDFVPIDLGSNRPITSVQDLINLQVWAERRDGLTDFNLGQERTSRTPATTTLALLEEANKRLDVIIRRQRIAFEELWDIIMSLYVQYGFSDRAMEVLLGPNFDRIQQAIDDMSVKELRDKVRFFARVSTQNLNRSVRRQEALTKFGQLREFNQEILGLTQAIKANLNPQNGQPIDSILDVILRGMYRGYHKTLGQFLDTFDERNQDAINPDLISLLEEVEPGVASAIPTFNQEVPGPGGPVEQALGAATAAGKPSGPIAPPGRPVAGADRVPQGSPEERNLLGGI